MRLLLDNCLSPKLAESARPIYSDIRFEALKAMYPADISDAELFANLSALGGWAVITLDSAIYFKPHQRVVWRQHGVTTFFLVQAWARLKLGDFASRFLGLVPNLQRAHDSCTLGTGFSVRLNGTLKRLP